MGEMTDNVDLGAACAFWQAGRDGGSSLLRASARVITGVPHYFCAPFIHKLEDVSRHDPEALKHGAVLLSALEGAAKHDASGWAEAADVPDRSFAGRGLRSAPQDDKIEERLNTGRIDMPLWGLSLDRAVADSYGGRFLLEVVGPFPAVAAWRVSHVKENEQELVTGGEYAVEQVDRSEGSTYARVRWLAPVQSRCVCDTCGSTA